MPPEYEVIFYTGIWHNASYYSYKRDSLDQAVRDLYFQFRVQGQACDEITEIRIVKINDEQETEARLKSQER